MLIKHAEMLAQQMVNSTVQSTWEFWRHRLGVDPLMYGPIKLSARLNPNGDT